MDSENVDTIQSYVGGVLIASGYADRSGDIATPNGIFYASTTDFFDYTIAEWRNNDTVQSSRWDMFKLMVRHKHPDLTCC